MTSVLLLPGQQWRDFTEWHCRHVVHGEGISYRALYMCCSLKWILSQNDSTIWSVFCFAPDIYMYYHKHRKKKNINQSSLQSFWPKNHIKLQHAYDAIQYWKSFKKNSRIFPEIMLLSVIPSRSKNKPYTAGRRGNPTSPSLDGMLAQHWLYF